MSALLRKRREMLRPHAYDDVLLREVTPGTRGVDAKFSTTSPTIANILAHNARLEPTIIAPRCCCPFEAASFPWCCRPVAPNGHMNAPRLTPNLLRSDLSHARRPRASTATS